MLSTPTPTPTTNIHIIYPACILNQLFVSAACPLVPVGAVGQHLIPDHDDGHDDDGGHDKYDDGGDDDGDDDGVDEDGDDDGDDAGAEDVPGQSSLLDMFSLYAVQLCFPLPGPVTII